MRHRSHVLSTVGEAAAFLEAFINERFRTPPDATKRGPVAGNGSSGPSSPHSAGSPAACRRRGTVLTHAASPTRGAHAVKGSALQVSVHQSGNLITTENSRRCGQGCGVRKLMRRVGIEPTTRWLRVK